MKITEGFDYILGKRFMEDNVVEPVRCTEELLREGQRIMELSLTAEEQLHKIDVASVFYKMEPDIANEIPKAKREEIFYGLKLGYASPIIPAKGLFLLEQVKKQFGCFNLLTRVVPASDLKKMFSKGYIAEGYTLRDVISTIQGSAFEPISAANPIVPHDEFWDIYIPATDMVAMVPTQIKEKLGIDDLEKITVRNRQLMLGNIPLAHIGGYAGSCLSCYDLRDVI